MLKEKRSAVEVPGDNKSGRGMDREEEVTGRERVEANEHVRH